MRIAEVSILKGSDYLEIPFRGNVSERLLRKLYRDKVFYCVRTGIDGKFYSKPCILSDYEWTMDFPFVRFFEDKMRLNIKSSTGTNWNDLYDSFEEAKREVRRRNDLFFNGFAYKPYLRLEILEEHKDQLIYIENEINKCLSGFENFQGIDFCDVHAGGIQIRGHHKQIKGYTYGSQPTIKYDFSNVEEVISEFIDMWRRKDNPQAIAKTKDFISWGERYGWD